MTGASYRVETLAWKTVPFSAPRTVPSMLSAEECRYLYWLTARVWSGDGDIMEIGPWLGGSTFCLAAGMRDSGHPAVGRLEVFDNFIWREFMAARAPLPLRPGQSFQPYFHRNVAPVSDIVRAYARTLPDEPIVDDPEATAKRAGADDAVPPFSSESDEAIEILFIDGAKSVRGMSYLLRTLSHRLLPGRTLLVCQDFKYWGTYWVPILMERLRSSVVPVHDVLRGTTVTFKLERPIPEAVLRNLPEQVVDLPTERSLEALGWAAGLIEDAGDFAGAWPVRLAAVSLLAHQGLTDRALTVLHSCQASWPLSVPSEQLERAALYLEYDRGMSVRWPLTWRLIRGARLGRAILGRLLRPRQTTQRLSSDPSA